MSQNNYTTVNNCPNQSIIYVITVETVILDADGQDLIFHTLKES